jgi:hypothetical protein
MAEKQKERDYTVMDYLRWRGDLTFAQDGFNEVDNLVLCMLSYLNFHRVEGLNTMDPARAVPIGEVSALLTDADEQQGLSQLDYLPLLRLAAQTPRFAETRLFGYVSEESEARETQFDAVSFLLPDGSVFAAFMGTDLSLVGWKEDFNMSFLSAVPAQEHAASYAAEIARACPQRKLRLGGHSKGGNLAVWAAVHLPEEIRREQLLAAYNNDGPGFSREFLELPAYGDLTDRLYTFIPESSVVGMLLEHGEDYDVIDSSNRLVMQHEPMSWNVLGNHFVRLGRRSQLGQLSDGVLREWLGSLTPQERASFTDALFDVLRMDDKARTLDDLRGGGLAGGTALLRSYIGVDEEKKRIIAEVLKRLAVDVKVELKRAAGEEFQAAREGLRAAGAALGLRRRG